MSKRRVLCAAGSAMMCCAMSVHAQVDVTKVPGIIDANGQTVGALTTFGPFDGVLITFGKAHAVIAIERKRDPDDTHLTYSASQYQWSTNQSIFYESANCSGDPVINTDIGPWPAVAFRNGSDVTVFFARNVPKRAITIASYRDSPTQQCTTYEKTFELQAYPPGLKINITQGHPEPLAIDY
jgi:hypothetical protein